MVLSYAEARLLLLLCLMATCNVLGYTSQIFWWFAGIVEDFVDYVYNVGSVLEKMRQWVAARYVALYDTLLGNPGHIDGW